MIRGIHIGCEVDTEEELRALDRDRKAVEAAVDADIKKFDEYFQSLGNDRLRKSEISTIKTYLHFKLFPPKS